MGHKLRRLLQQVLVLVIPLFGYTFFTDRDFAQWQLQFRQLALNNGIQAETFDLAFRGLTPDSKVLRLDAYQPEFSRTTWEYLDKSVSADRLRIGQQKWQEHSALLKKISSRYGVQQEYLLAIWGMESGFGQRMGNYSIMRSMATLAYAGRYERRGFWQDQLLAALRILQKKDVTLSSLRGSWAGAIGHTQFMPLTFERYAVDFDGDGQRDLVNSLADALASTANYLAQSGWKKGQVWGEEVTLPTDFDWAQADPVNWQPLAYWSGQGVQLVNGNSLADWRDELAFILLPAGYRGPAFLAYQNFRALLEYNNSVNYALAVGTLGDQLRGDRPVVAEWPRFERDLSRYEKAELQELLSAVGYSTDGIDGKIGVNTRAALRRWQADVGLPSDGYPTFDQLQLLREQTEIPFTYSIQEASG
ncbi:lytic murein transglycosylase [Thiolinea disciformis]|uniref:lytic murein transglycosylase n=1 Tax=Thiolinea disciformis TaxID=125614 RepID=UPI00036B3DE0|nr:lytic murein transglycosylase [Thiolinea disciformis]